MIEALQTIGITSLSYMVAFLIAGCIGMIGFWIFNKGPLWLKLTVGAAIFSLLVIGPIYGLFFASSHETHVDEYEYRPDTGQDRYR